MLRGSYGEPSYRESGADEFEESRWKKVIQITEQQKAYLKSHGVAIEDALAADDLDTLLEVIDEAIVENIVTHHDEPDETGIKLQRIYDEIRFMQNAGG